MEKSLKRKKNKTIEVELRGLLTKTQYNSLIQRLKKERVKFEKDDKDTYFFNVPDGVFKLCDEKAKSRGKISLKIGKEETGALEEMEIIIKRDQIKPFFNIFAALGYIDFHHVPQKRKNYFLNGAELALKFTPDFQYHFELEGELLNNVKQINKEREKLLDICHHYKIVPLEPAEIASRIKEIRQRIGFEKYLQS
jgi:adenylate cyclase class IV